LKIDFPDDESMRISHEAIYQALYVQGRGALRRELTACLRSGKALRVPRARIRGRGKSFVTEQIMISERPPEADDRAVPGHWEGDLILGADRNQTKISVNIHPLTKKTFVELPFTEASTCLGGGGLKPINGSILLYGPEVKKKQWYTASWHKAASKTTASKQATIGLSSKAD
jgi:hypothetical protein